MQPHCTETFKLSTDPQFIEKVRDIVGPMRPGQVERRTHDYECHGTTTLFAGFIAAVTAETDVKAGSVMRSEIVATRRVDEA